MATGRLGRSSATTAASAGPAQNYRQLWRQTLLRLLLTYLTPLLLLSVYFHVQYRNLLEASRRSHFLAMAETQAGMLDLFLRERMVNLVNLIDDPYLPERPSSEATAQALARLQRDSATFVDLGFFDAHGTMVAYAGPYPSLLARSYGREPWFRSLRATAGRTVVTDMYMGFRQRPHFTMAVRRADHRGPEAVRATLDPERFHDYVRSLRGGSEAQVVLVNAGGRYQDVNLPEALSRSRQAIVPPRNPVRGIATWGAARYSYCWLQETDWALVVLWDAAPRPSMLLGVDAGLVALSLGVILTVFVVIVIRTRSVVRHQIAEDSTRQELSGQLHHAARLASVGELAAGIAHEINNPLAIIAEEAGLMQDLMSPELGGSTDPTILGGHLQTIHDAVFRARDVTRKLLGFVRKTDVTLERHDLQTLIEGVIGGLLEREMKVANIEVQRLLADALPPVLVDRGQIEQVVINLVTNAIDAMPSGGRLTLASAADGDRVRFSVSDTGVGMDAEALNHIFMPFHTTKEVGKGTGLGLSVSYGIVKNHGGEILVESKVGQGSTFTVVLPIAPTAQA